MNVARRAQEGGARCKCHVWQPSFLPPSTALIITQAAINSLHIASTASGATRHRHADTTFRLLSEQGPSVCTLAPRGTTQRWRSESLLKHGYASMNPSSAIKFTTLGLDVDLLQYVIYGATQSPFPVVLDRRPWMYHCCLPSIPINSTTTLEIPSRH